MIHKKFLILILFPFFLFSQEEKRLALVIGNANYEKGELKNPVNDAKLIASTLDSLDFDVILKENLESQNDFKRAILEFGKKRPNYDVAFVYYAGHGIQIDDVNYLLPTKEGFISEDEVEMFGVSVQDIMRYLRAQTNEVNILILDACRDNPFESKWNSKRSAGGKGGGLAKIPPPTGSLIAFSTDSGQTAPDGDGDNSIYSISLAKSMLLEDTSIDQVFRNVRAEVLEQTEGAQRPVEATQLTGQTFYLNPTDINNLLYEIDKLIEEEKFDEARSKIEPIVDKYPLNNRALLIRAKIFFGSGNYLRSIKDINTLIELKSISDELFYWRAKNYIQINEYQKAEVDFTKAIELDSENDEHYYDRGYFYSYDLEDYEKAITDFTKAIELDPTDPKNYFRRADAFNENEQYNQALSDYLKAEELDKDKGLAKTKGLYNNIAINFENLEQFDKAIEYYTKEIEIDPDDFKSYINRATLYSNLKYFEKAEVDFTKAIELDSENDEHYYDRGHFYRYDLEDYEKAIIDFTKAIELDPKDPINYFLRADAFNENEQYNQALSDYLKAEELDKDKSIAKSDYLYNDIAVNFVRLEQFDKAIEYYTKEIEINPDNYIGYQNRAYRYLNLKNYEKAEVDFTKAIELDSENDEHYYRRGYFYSYDLEDYEKAITDFTKAIELDPKNPENYFRRADAFRSNEQYNQALSDYLKAEELDKDKSLAKTIGLYNDIAVNFVNLEQFDKSIEYYTKEIEINPNDYLGYRNRALRYSYLKDYKKAEVDFTKAIELDSENDQNYYARGEFYSYDLEDYEKAITDFDKAIELNPSASNIYERANNRYNLNNYELAISDYLRALELDVDEKVSKNEYLLNGLAMSYKKLGNLDNAIIYLKKEIEISPNYNLGYRNLGDIYVELREFDKARQIYKNLISIDENKAQNYFFRALFFMNDVEDYLSAFSDLSKAIDLEKDNSKYYFTRAQLNVKNKDFENAIKDFEKTLELNPEIINTEYIYAEIAECYANFGDFEKALEYYDMEISSDENAHAYSERAIFFDSYLNDFDKAKIDFEKSIVLAPKTNNIVLKYLNFLYSNKKYDQALELSKKAQEIEPKDPQSDFVSASIYMEINKPFQALTMLNSCIEKIIKYSGEGYYISARDDTSIDFSEIFMMRGNFYKDKDKELMCSDYKEALKYTFNESQKEKINLLLSKNCVN